MRKYHFLTLLVLALGLGTPNVEDALGDEFIVQSFDDLSFRPLDGLEHLGVTFDFKLDGIDSNDAYFASYGPVSTEYVSDPSIVGNSRGILTMQFDVPTSVLRFGLALSDAGAIAEAVHLAFYNELGELLGNESANASASMLATGFSELRFDYGGAPIHRVVLDFADAPGSFALDNLTYVVPEPNMAWSAGVFSLLAIAASTRRRLLTLMIAAVRAKQ